jgi:hypothetical protein
VHRAFDKQRQDRGAHVAAPSPAASAASAVPVSTVMSVSGRGEWRTPTPEAAAAETAAHPGLMHLSEVPHGFLLKSIVDVLTIYR